MATDNPDTIFALSSGTPPCGVAIIRISGPGSGRALNVLAGRLPNSRQASLRQIRDPQAGWLDEALVLWFPGPSSATGEDCAEIHCHGGRAVIRAIENSLAGLGLRQAEPGEFTRRAFLNGRMDLLEAEALGDMLSAETELQRAVLASSAKGHASNEVAHWREAVLSASAAVEQELDFSDDDQDGIAPTPGWCSDARRVAEEMAAWLAVPPAERLREGLRVVLAGPPNSGKSSLFNAILDEAAAIVSPIAGTTRDAIERPVAIGGVPFLLVDTAGLRDEGADEIERIGISRAGQELARADVVLWLGPEGEGPSGVIEVASMMDAAVWAPKGEGSLAVSAVTGEGLPELMSRLSAVGRDRLPKPGQVAVSRRQKQRLETARLQLLEAAEVEDLLIAGEALRQARHALDAMLGTVGTEDMLDSLFGRFCIGK
ncbi:MAG: tRNA uridine-5-carboxymethylaminomethyl(34) synthesis GTPase MnmE [Alteriqipengyuania sp.]|uniref:tRNA uridine-5-carboxymethylaminomethyl(34) synthesis GTPase MnmE n=1 Tax=Alphaproteobacteria TaxID=28211 RepID=UPI000C105472|nr:tRNA uridine-5-carboxymethylaminomethyl(34) synthesis GTPase MnmE [Citromicrobium sp.]MBO80831.1 tRNA uridine-5-carboxymethylaminomethyl(34) synthesis GTPase MnmE [Citromicrobium sp.]PHR70559.1 MAG: tRNA uridine-5-carboxymethylaminomethyl(34) synthesis GTPase MnmE [Henriciella sp.]